MFENFKVSEFWEASPEADKSYIDAPPTDATLAIVEEKLKHKLPASYVTLMKMQNGGIPKRTNHRTSEPTSWADDHVAIVGIYSIGKLKTCSLCGEAGSQFWIDEWKYPAIGVYFADCPSGGHDMLCLDYRECGPTGEPSVVHVDKERDYKITPVAKNFEAFILGLESDDAFDLE